MTKVKITFILFMIVIVTLSSWGIHKLLTQESDSKKDLKTGELLKIILTQKKEDFNYSDNLIKLFPQNFFHLSDNKNFETITNIVEKCIQIITNNTGFNAFYIFYLLSKPNMIYKKNRDGRKDLQVLNASDALEILVGRIFTSKTISVLNKKEFLTTLFTMLILGNMKYGNVQMVESSNDGIFFTKEILSERDSEQMKKMLRNTASRFEQLKFFNSIANGETVSFEEVSNAVVALFEQKYNTDWTNIDPFILLRTNPNDIKKFENMEIIFDDMYEVTDEFFTNESKTKFLENEIM